MIRDPWLRALSVIACAIGSVYLTSLLWTAFQQVADIVLLFFLAWLLAFVLQPVVSAFTTQLRVPRLLAIGATYIAILVLLSVGVILLAPALTAQVVEVARNLPAYAEQITAWATAVQGSTNAWLLDHNSPLLFDIGSVLNADQLSRRAEESGAPVLGNVVQVLAGAATVLVEIAILVMLSFYFMVDGARLGEQIILALPVRAQDDARLLVVTVHSAFAGYLRGQLLQALIGAVGTGVAMAFFHLDYALLASVAVGIVLLIPFVGPAVAVALPTGIALLTQPTDPRPALILFIVLVLMQQLLFNLLGPRILSQQVGLHPLFVLFAVLIGARLAGVWGAVFGVPILAVMLRMASFYRASRDERVARLHAHLPGQDLVSVDSGPLADPTEPRRPVPLTRERAGASGE